MSKFFLPTFIQQSGFVPKAESAEMTTEKFHEELQRARLELSAALAVVMGLAKTGKAFGAEWEKALERERKARQKMHCVLNSALAYRVDGKHRAIHVQRDGSVDA